MRRSLDDQLDHACLYCRYLAVLEMKVLPALLYWEGGRSPQDSSESHGWGPAEEPG